MAGEETAGSDEWLAGFAEALGESARRWRENWPLWPDAGTPGAGPGTMDAGMLDAQLELWRDFQALWLNTTARLAGREAPAVIAPEPDDHRFRDSAWTDNPVFDFLKQSYLLNARWLRRTLAGNREMDEDRARTLDFVGRQIVDAMSPTNFALTNPAVLREMRETEGESLLRGFRNLAADLEDARYGLRPRQTDMDAFEIGVDLAASPGAVVFETPLMQLLQYAPTTERVHERPLLIVPPWINKFYILDLRPDNSFVRWATGQGYTVFVISWVNPDERFAGKGFDDYAADGILAAVDAVGRATGASQLTAIGYCIGGTLLAATLAHMAAAGDRRIAAATFLAAQADFEDAGDLRVFTGEAQMGLLRRQVEAKGYLDGAYMAGAFNALRANDLIWHFVVNNYLLGKEPPAFDLLYWNADSTRFPARLLFDYVREMYQRNALARPRGFELLGRPVDLGAVRIPTYVQASREDHIAPAVSVYKLTRLLGGSNRFVLAGSGHIAGVVNPPAKNKYGHWLPGGRRRHPDFESWFGAAIEHPGSWWPDWHRWNARRSGKKVPARRPGDGGLDPIEPAPGSYVKLRS